MDFDMILNGSESDHLNYGLVSDDDFQKLADT